MPLGDCAGRRQSILQEIKEKAGDCEERVVLVGDMNAKDEEVARRRAGSGRRGEGSVGWMSRPRTFLSSLPQPSGLSLPPRRCRDPLPSAGTLPAAHHRQEPGSSRRWAAAVPARVAVRPRQHRRSSVFRSICLSWVDRKENCGSSCQVAQSGGVPLPPGGGLRGRRVQAWAALNSSMNFRSFSAEDSGRLL